MKKFNELFVKPSPVYKELSGPMLKKVEDISQNIDKIAELSDIYEASLSYNDGVLTIRLVMDYVEGWWNTEPGLFELIGLLDSLNAYTNETLEADKIIIMELKVREKN